MAGRGAPSFLKRQKELTRNARNQQKRAQRQAKRDERASGGRGTSPLDEYIAPLDGPVPLGVDGLPVTASREADREAEPAADDDGDPSARPAD